MRYRFFERSPGNSLRVVIVLALFCVVTLLHFRHTGDDLAASYVGCRLVATGDAAHLYSYSPELFSEIGSDDREWKMAAAQGNFTGVLHPYVQTPLWAYALRPLCTNMHFRAFRLLFAALTMLCFAGSLWLIAARWVPDLLNPYAMGLICVGVWFSEPFRYAIFLMQTHILFYLLVLGALAWADRRPGWAGLLLAVAAAVKITPGFLVLYWLLTRRWRAAASMVGWSVALAGLTLAVAGRGLVAEYLAGLHRIGETLLVSLNNQSLASWSMGRFYSTDELYQLQSFHLPTGVRLGSMALLLLCTVAGGWMDRRRGQDALPLGAMLALVGATVFSPIAWTHYYIVLVAPLMLLAAENRVLRSKALWIAIAIIVALNFQPIAPGVLSFKVYAWTVVRSHFYSGVLCLGALAYAGWRDRRVMKRGAGMEADEEMEQAAAA